MLGKAVKGPIALELRNQNISKILFLAKIVF
jgi:ribosomal protein L14